ncbi:hypothetical protein N6H18_16890 [Reichenbachiella agarivorans]|uniref:Thioredoxin domain-containing protein n=1 Tax=Reichenbachiella agarivorans TaxID=2979464 RepID=A0ABY6CNC1_9BACT|nr:hypothetical protein [Reichenbachiella agarivorans]UXP32021.1 hypothetical protein N6H18_16890 [Reichenbachiella agarivorans]
MKCKILGLFIVFAMTACDRSEVYKVEMDECLKNITLKPSFMLAAGIRWDSDSIMSDCQTLSFEMNGLIDGERPKVNVMGFRGGIFENPYGVNFKIALLDYNNNGKYTDVDVDRLFIVPQNTDSLLTIITGLERMMGNDISVNVDGRVFRLSAISEDGLEVEVTPVDDPSTLVDVIDFSFDISRYTFKDTFTQSIIEGNDLVVTGKKTYIYHYSNTCRPCIKAIPKLKELNESCGDVAVRFVAHGQRLPVERNRQFLSRFGIDEHAIVPEDADFFGAFDLYAYAEGILFDEQGQIEKIHVNPDQILRGSQ